MEIFFPPGNGVNSPLKTLSDTKIWQENADTNRHFSICMGKW